MTLFHKLPGSSSDTSLGKIFIGTLSMGKPLFSDLGESHCSLLQEYDWISVTVVIEYGLSSQKDKYV